MQALSTSDFKSVPSTIPVIDGPLFFRLPLIFPVTFCFYASLTRVLIPVTFSHPEWGNSSRSFNFPFLREHDASRAAISLVTRSFLRARQVIFRRLSFFRSSRRNCRGSRVTAINFPPSRGATINRATARTFFFTPILQAKLNLYYSEILSSPGKTGKLVSPELAERSIYTYCQCLFYQFHFGSSR